MARRIYSIIIALAFVLGFILNEIKDSRSGLFVVVAAGIIFTIFSTGVHGLAAHSINPKLKGGFLTYPLFMGLLWMILFFLFVFFILPIFCPNFLP